MARSLQLLFAASKLKLGGGWIRKPHPSTSYLALAFLSVLIFANAGLAQADSIYRLPAGTRISVRLDAELSSRVASVNDTFLAMVAKPVVVRETVVVPEDTVLEGRVTKVSRAAGGLKNGKLDVVFETLRISRTERRIEAEIVTAFTPPSSGTVDAISILGGTIVGALVGSRSSASGALIGAGVGAGAGSGIALLRKGKEMKIPKGEEFEIELKKEVVLPVLDY